MTPSSVILISASPATITLEEHQRLVQSTPTSFSDIPPVLRLRQDDVSIEFEPVVEGITVEELSKGTLYISERYASLQLSYELSGANSPTIVTSALAFIASSSGKGFSVLYPNITIHAVSRSGTRPMVYCQIEQARDDDAGDDENAELLELKMFPQDSSKSKSTGLHFDRLKLPSGSHTHRSVDDVFEALSYCASLHPDPNLGPDDGDDVFYDGEFKPFTGQDDEELSEVGRVRSDFVSNSRFQPY